MDMQDKGVIHVLGGTEQNGMRFNHIMQNDMQLKIYGLLICTIFCLISDCGLLQVTVTMENKIVINEDTVWFNSVRYYFVEESCIYVNHRH